jgi:hypothetical protein
MNLNKIYFVTLCAFTLSCGKKDDNSKSDEGPKNPAPVAAMPAGLRSQLDDQNLLGTWTEKCEVVDGKSYQASLEFGADFLIYTNTVYQDLLCRTVTSRFRFISEYRTENGKLYAQLVEAHIKIESESIRVAAEKSRSCGFDKWTASTWHNVTGQTCPKTEATGGVWTSWTKPGRVILNEPYEILNDRLTFVNSDSAAEFFKQ